MLSAPATPSNLQSAFLSLRRELENYIARRVRCPQIAEDLASEIYLKLERVETLIATENEARRFLFRVAANVTTDHIRNTRRRVEILEEEAYLLEKVNPSAERATMARSQLAIIDAALAELPERAREILFDVRVGGMAQDEVAAKYGVSRSYVEKYLARAVQHCRTRLREAESGEVSASSLFRGHGSWLRRFKR